MLRVVVVVIGMALAPASLAAAELGAAAPADSVAWLHVPQLAAAVKAAERSPLKDLVQRLLRPDREAARVVERFGKTPAEGLALLLGNRWEELAWSLVIADGGAATSTLFQTRP